MLDRWPTCKVFVPSNVGWLIFSGKEGDIVIAEVVIDIQNKQVNRTFDYLIPPHLEGILKVGYRVHVPFGRMKRVGFITKIKSTTDYQKNLKTILDTIDVYPVLTEEFIELAKYIAEHNFSFYATALQTMIPTALKIKYQKIAKIVHPMELSKEAKSIMKRKEMIVDGFSDDQLAIIFEEVKKGNIILDTKLKKQRDKDSVEYVVLNDTDVLPTSRQGKSVVSYLEELGEEVELAVLLEDSGYSKSVVSTLAKKGIITIFQRKILKEINNVASKEVKSKVQLNESQRRVYESIDYNSYKTYLLHGVTGSGKTEVYMCWIEAILQKGRSAILLVPEISLTPQITGLFKQRFSSDIAILHSRLTPSEKYKEWKKIYNHEIKIVVGARSAIFAPLDNLGIIIIDECHESSYIQQNNPKYSAIEIAQLRAKRYSCPLILGSATPNITDYYYATNGEYELLSMPMRVNQRPLPESTVVDMRQELISGNKEVFSKKLQQELIDCYKRKEQSILFLNRRGYSSFVMCRSCGEVVKCPHCDVSLTYHASTQTLKCHYCGYTTPNVTRCYHCGSDKIRFVGSGTEKIYDAALRLLPEARVLRVDMDTTNRMEDYERAFYQFKNHEADILIGTQMITKGLDFSDVTLVGVVNADLALSYPSYDASMVAYNLIEQVSGRAGRADKDGKVIIQTYNPNHYVIECAKRHDYDTFFTTELQNRKITLMPPYSIAIEVKISSAKADMAYQEAKTIAENLKKVAKSSIILGPVEATIFKKKDIYSFILQIQAVEDAVLDKIKYIYPVYQNNKDVSISITRMG